MSQKIQFEISKDFESQEVHTIDNVRTMTNLDLPVQHFDVEGLTERCPYIVQGDLSGLRGGQPRLLIGQDNCGQIVSKEVIELKPKLIAVSPKKNEKLWR
jgi:hypothetical protein